MGFFGIVAIIAIVFMGFEECSQQKYDHDVEMKKQEFRLDSMKAANRK